MYSDDEVLGVVEQLVRTSVRRDYDDLGVRRTDRTFSDIQEVAASVFLLYPGTPYYLAYLCANKLSGTLSTLNTNISDMLSRVAVLRRRSVPVRDLSSLVNAKVALFELETAGTSSVQDSPAWKRVDTNLARFLARVGSNIKLNGDIVVTPEQARAELPALITTFNAQATELARLVMLLSLAVNDYNAVDLAKYGKGVITNARLLLTETIDTLEALDDAGRLAALRDAVLKVAAMKGVIRDYGTFVGVSSFVLTGTAAPFSDTTRPSVGATLALQTGPYSLAFGTGEDDSTNALRLAADVSGTGVRFSAAATSANSSPNTTFTRGSGSFIADGVVAGDLVDILTGASAGETRRVQSVGALVLLCAGPTLGAVGAVTINVVRSPNLLYLSPSYVARIDGIVDSPFNIQAGVNDNLQFSIDGGASIPVPLTAGPAQTAAQVKVDVDAALNASGYGAEAFFAPLLFDGGVYTSALNVLSLPFGSFPTSLFSIGNEVDFYFGDNVGVTRVVTGFTSNTITVDGAPLLANFEDRIRVGGVRRLRIKATSSLVALNNKSSLKIQTPTDVEVRTGGALGFYGEMLAQSRPSDAALLVTSLNLSTKLATASVRDDVKVANALIRTETSSVIRLVVYKQRTTASYGSGTNIVFTLDDVVASTLVIGDTLVLREGFEPGTTGVVTAVTASTVTATMASSLTAATSQIIEVGESALFAPDDVLVVADGPNEGRYYVDTVYGPPFELSLRTGIVSQNRTNFNDPVLMTGSVVREGLNLTSKSAAVASTLEIYDPLHIFFTTDGPHQATATTTYMGLPTVKGVAEGDMLELYTTGSVIPDVSATILSVFDDNVVELDTAVDATVSYTMAEGRAQLAPSAVLRKAQNYNYDTFKSDLDAWQARAPWKNLTAYFTDLNRLVNPLLVNQNPTDSDVNTVELKILALAGTLTIDLATTASLVTQDSLEAILATYSVDRIHEVDAMLKTLQERGADRALDLLLECQFQTFFGVTLEDSSYGGAFQKAMRNVLMNDLPINKVRRVESTEGKLTTTTGTDYEYSLDDIDNTLKPDPPVYNTD